MDIQRNALLNYRNHVRIRLCCVNVIPLNSGAISITREQDFAGEETMGIKMENSWKSSTLVVAIANTHVAGGGWIDTTDP